MSGQVRRIIFAGTPDFAVPSLRAIAASGHELCAVLTQPDRPAGRGRRTQPGPVKQLALELDANILQPSTLRDQAAQDRLNELAPDLMVVVAYGMLLPASVLAIPVRGCINVHASLLPRWRGAAPIQAAIRAGDRETGISLMQLDAGLDTGPVFATAETTIGADETAGQLHDRLAQLGADLLATHLDAILAGRLDAKPQADVGVTYATRIDKAEAIIDWSEPSVDIACLVRAFNPWPVAETLFDGQRLRIWSASAEPEADVSAAGPAGEILACDADGVQVRTGAGCVRLLSVQMPGRQRIDAAAFAHGYQLRGKVLGQ